MNKVSFNIINPSRFPFFYGYVVMVMGTLGVWASLPGQTVGVSIFTDPGKEAVGLSRDQFSTAYMIGTLMSSFFISAAGRWFDRYGARIVAAASALVLAASLLLASIAHKLTAGIESLFSFNHWVIPFVVMVLLFFMFRFSGQGVLTMSSRNMVMKWFERYRGRVNAFSALSISLGFSIAPVILDRLITTFQWDGAWRVMGFSLLLMTILIILTFRDNPEKYGLIPDGRKAKKGSKAIESKPLRSFEPKEAFQTRAFWMYALMLSFNSFFITGFTFHVISIFETSGYARSEAVAIFIPIAVVSVAISLIFNFISDWIRLKVLLYIMIGGGLLASLGMGMISSTTGVYLIVAGQGIMGGMFSVLNAVTWPRLFGRKYIGTISGKAMAMIVFASALAPVLFSLSHTRLGNYEYIAIPSVLFVIFVALASIKANNPRLPA
ncbi:MFS transporter [Alkalitalea saponilacus]|uniref:Major Facilitator Superfamily protein n=1 Tax=Alkalitalea saponilacus TaxID=889453 RepID=A0A1T5HNR0_9BACT|nr:MFS transporter [Alkalitalea saponilacus]ASB49344.1 MFS transporter [Alkalitalea saponilacus]SKC22181.1 Major Facilitator Superfamily protein [Alkalitalea saponilacus]